jgi:hypothetical protein
MPQTQTKIRRGIIMILDSLSYQKVKQIKDGIIDQHSIFKDLTNWMNKTFEYNILCCGYYRERINAKDPYTINRLDLYAFDNFTYFRMQEDGFNLREYGKNYPNEEKTLNHFKGLLVKNKISTFSLFNKPTIYSTLEKTDYDKIFVDPKGLFVISHSFEMAYREEIIQINSNSLKELIKNQFSNFKIYKVDFFFGCINIFYESIIDKAKYDEDGTSEKVKRACFEYIKTKDEYDLIKINNFSFQTESDELIRTKYDGNYFNYYR